ncbi:MAG: EI24 domain-containing protein [Enhydrobacter sp.]|nr:MAG: EI24 domain-containing protein [Enhydrobacter sp.]
MIRAFELAVRQLGDPRLRSVLWQSLLLSLVLQAAIAALAWWALQSFATFQWSWVNDLIRWLGGGAVVFVALLLFPASFGIIVSIFMERIADIVESEHYPELGPAHGIPLWAGIWSGLVFLVTLIVLNLVMLPFYLLALFIAGLGVVLFYGINGWLTGREYYEQVALRRLERTEVKAWRKANVGQLWLTGIVIAFLGTIPVLNLIVPVIGMAAMVHVARTLRSPAGTSNGTGRPFNPPVERR